MRSTAGEDPADSRLGRWALRMVRWRWLVLGSWAVVLALSLAASAQLGELLSNRYSVPGSEAQQVEDILEQRFGLLSEGVVSVVVESKRTPPETAPQHDAKSKEKPPPRMTRDQLYAAAFAATKRASREMPQSKVDGAVVLSDTVAVGTFHTKLELADSKSHIPAVRSAVGDIKDANTYVTGSSPITHDLDPVLSGDLRRGELYFGGPIALVILAFVFGSLAFVLPFAFALVAIPGTLAVIWVFAHPLDLSSFVTNLVVGVGLGLAIDYSLLMFQRYREERLTADGIDNTAEARRQAVGRTMLTAGRAVIFSGTAVAIGLALLLLMPLPFMQGFGIAGLAIPIVSIIAAVTLLPALLYVAGHRAERLRFLPQRMLDKRDRTEGSGWMRLARTIMRHPWPFFLTSAALLLALAIPARNLEVIPGGSSGFPESLSSMRGSAVLERTLGEGAITPIVLLVDAGEGRKVTDPQIAKALEQLYTDLPKLEPESTGMAGLVPTQPAEPGMRAAPRRVTGPFIEARRIDASGRYARIEITTKHQYGDKRVRYLVQHLRDEHASAMDLPQGTRVLIGGTAGIGVDLVDTILGAFPWLVAGVLVLTYFLLLRAFRSLLLPLKAIVLNLLSIGAAYGLLELVFLEEWGKPLGLHTGVAVEAWIPVFMFAMLFGVSMDYEVFLVSRMREAWDSGATNEEAVALGLAHTGRLVTAAGAIMVAAFGGFMLARPVGFQQFGLGLASAILIDVTVVRAILLPSAMKLFGRWNWWLPEWAARIARVEASPLRDSQAA